MKPVFWLGAGVMAVLMIGFSLNASAIQAATPFFNDLEGMQEGPGFPGLLSIYDYASGQTYQAYAWAWGPRICTNTDGYNPAINADVTVQIPGEGPRTVPERTWSDGKTLWGIEYMCGDQGTVNGVEYSNFVFQFARVIK